jgi:hypothetical protein
VDGRAGIWVLVSGVKGNVWRAIRIENARRLEKKAYD